jgi:hypothetical protein
VTAQENIKRYEQLLGSSDGRRELLAALIHISQQAGSYGGPAAEAAKAVAFYDRTHS